MLQCSITIHELFHFVISQTSKNGSITPTHLSVSRLLKIETLKCCINITFSTESTSSNLDTFNPKLFTFGKNEETCIHILERRSNRDRELLVTSWTVPKLGSSHKNLYGKEKAGLSTEVDSMARNYWLDNIDSKLDLILGQLQ